MPTIPGYSPPAGLDDFDLIPSQKDGWSKYIAAAFDRAIARTEAQVGAGKCQFHNETKTASDNPEDELIIWEAFPRTLVRQFGRPQALQLADQPAPDPAANGALSRIQDEYCEWQVTRDPTTNKILRVTFTCEGPEYWQSIAGGPSIYNDAGESPRDFGANGDKQVLLQLYRDILGNPNIPLEDLFNPNNPDEYNPWNVWNTTKGIVHLQQINNTLQAEITIGADATVRRQKGGQEITEATRLICCGGFGGAERSSDPRIGIAVNTRCREGFAVTLRDPVGIYFDSFDNAGFTKPGPNGTRVPAENFWKPLRGQGDMIVRAVYEVPANVTGPSGEVLTVSDLQIAGVAIQFGGQIAERMKMKFVARKCRPGTFNNPAFDCIAKCCLQGGVLRVRKLTDPCTDVFPGPGLGFAEAAAARGVSVRVPTTRGIGLGLGGE